MLKLPLRHRGVLFVNMSADVVLSTKCAQQVGLLLVNDSDRTAQDWHFHGLGTAAIRIEDGQLDVSHIFDRDWLAVTAALELEELQR